MERQYAKKHVKNLKNRLFWRIFARFFSNGHVKGFAFLRFYGEMRFAGCLLLDARFVLKKILLDKNEKKSIFAVCIILCNGNSGNLCPVFLCQR